MGYEVSSLGSSESDKPLCFWREMLETFILLLDKAIYLTNENESYQYCSNI